MGLFLSEPDRQTILRRAFLIVWEDWTNTRHSALPFLAWSFYYQVVYTEETPVSSTRQVQATLLLSVVGVYNTTMECIASQLHGQARLERINTLIAFPLVLVSFLQSVLSPVYVAVRGVVGKPIEAALKTSFALVFKIKTACEVPFFPLVANSLLFITRR